MSKTFKTIQLLMLTNLIAISMPLAMDAGQVQQSRGMEFSDEGKDHLIDELQRLIGTVHQLNRDEIKNGELFLIGRLADKTDDEKREIFNTLGNMTWLQRLYLSENRLTEVPAVLFNLTNLQGLYLFENRLTSIPPELGNLTNLQWLYLSENRLTEVPAVLFNLTNLQGLDLSYNRLTEVPAALFNLTGLQVLYLTGNRLTQVPPELGNLTNLQRLYLSDNQLTEVPAALFNLTGLQWLDLSYNQLTSVPASIGQIRALTMLVLENLPNLLERGESPDQWGRQELRHHFGDRVQGLDQQKPQVAMPRDTTADQVYQALNARPYRINLPVFTGNHLPEVTVEHVFSGDDIVESLVKILRSLNFTDPNKPAYMEYETIANDFAGDAENSELSNVDKVWEFLVPRLTGYFRTLYDMPLESKDVAGWAMYEDKIPQTQKVLSFILQKIEAEQNPDTKMALFYQLVNGLLHCPTGQSEGINTVAFALLEGKAVGDSFAKKIKRLLALKKNDWFTTTILARASDNSQNVHLISSYRGQLKDTLGLLSPLHYDERMGTFGFDPFTRNPANVLKVYFELVTPDSLVTWVMDKLQNQEDLALVLAQGKIETTPSNSPKPLDGKFWTDFVVKQGLVVPEAIMDDKGQHIADKRLRQDWWSPWFTADPRAENAKFTTQGWRKMIQFIKAKIKSNKQYRLFTTSDALTYMHENHLVDSSNENWWHGLVTADPFADEEARLTRDGVKKILIHMGFLIDERQNPSAMAVE